MRTKEEIVADLRNADRLGAPIDAGAIADQIEIAFAELAEIVAEMRTRSREVKEAFGGRPDGVENMLDIWAGRIEAVTERERAAWDECAARCVSEHNLQSNAAAMREAAATVYNVLEKLKTFSLHIGDIGHKREFNHLVCLAKNRLDAALAAPARNCDRYEDAPSAYADFIVPWKLDGHLDDVPTLQDFANWLFAPAAERRGEDYGK